MCEGSWFVTSYRNSRETMLKSNQHRPFILVLLCMPPLPRCEPRTRQMAPCSPGNDPGSVRPWPTPVAERSNRPAKIARTDTTSTSRTRPWQDSTTVTAAAAERFYTALTRGWWYFFVRCDCGRVPTGRAEARKSRARSLSWCNARSSERSRPARFAK